MTRRGRNDRATASSIRPSRPATVALLCASSAACTSDRAGPSDGAAAIGASPEAVARTAPATLPEPAPTAGSCLADEVLTIGPGRGGRARTWTIDAVHEYCAAFAGAVAVAEVGSLTLFTLGAAPERGAWAGSSITVDHTLHGAGRYTLVPPVELDRTRRAAPDTPLASVRVVAGTATPRFSLWAASAGELGASVDAAGRYRFHSPDGLTLAHDEDGPGGGIAGRPATIVVTFTELSEPVAASGGEGRLDP